MSDPTSASTATTSSSGNMSATTVDTIVTPSSSALTGGGGSSSPAAAAPPTTTAAAPSGVETKAATTKKSESALKAFLSGGVGGVCVVLTGHPLDLIKVRMQTGGGAAGATVFGMLRKTFVTEGVRGLYRGVSAPLTAVTPMFAVSFWGYDMGKKTVRAYDDWRHGGGSSHPGEPIKTLTIGQLCAAGGISAIPTTIIMTPSERIKCLLQVQANEIEKGGKAKYTGMFDCAKQVLKEGGIRSLYKGTGATLLRDVPGTIAYYGTYEIVKKELMEWQGIDPAKGQLSPFAIVCAGGFAGMACWGISIPPDVLKSRYQTAPPGQYSGLYDVYKHLMKEEGAAGLFKGMRPALIRAFPANAACFLGMEVSRSMLSFMD